MNSEELELSLRTEFENYLKGVMAEMRQEVADFQTKFTAELEKHRAQVDEAFRGFTSRLDPAAQFDQAFKASVSEHLRLARDEGAKITAEAFAEAEKLEKQNAPAPPAYNAVRDAVADISGQESQSGILKSLVHHAADFAPRGAFFILKNEHLAGWRVFGASTEAEESVREVHFPVSTDTVLCSAVKNLETVDGDGLAHAQDTVFLDKLGFGRPDRMLAVPLIARGKAVAVLYADHGDSGAELNREVLETLVRVAGLTVELHAVAQTPAPAQEAAKPTVAEPKARADEAFHAPSEPAVSEFAYSSPEPEEQPQSTGFSFDTAPAYDETPYASHSVPAAAEQEPFSAREPERVPELVPEYAAVSEASNGSGAGQIGYERSLETTGLAAPPFDSTPQPDYTPQARADYSPGAPVHEPVAEPQMRYEAPAPPQPQFTPAPQPAPEPPPAAPAVEKTIQPIGQVASTPKSRLSERPVDLPIDVPEQERRLHNDARRFARLLVSEIKLYNEKKVQEGRQEWDLYERLREAIDRSREMYDKRVQPPVAAKFDYFHYELVNSLAEGNAERLGAGYPGPTI